MTMKVSIRIQRHGQLLKFRIVLSVLEYILNYIISNQTTSHASGCRHMIVVKSRPLASRWRSKNLVRNTWRWSAASFQSLSHPKLRSVMSSVARFGNPPSSPHNRSNWESAVQSVKKSRELFQYRSQPKFELQYRETLVQTQPCTSHAQSYSPGADSVMIYGATQAANGTA